MKVKRYIGKSTNEAMKKLKLELGSNAVILHTRKMKKPGLLGLFKKPLVEIVAAVDNDVNDNQKNKEKNTNHRLYKSSINKDIFIKKNQNENDLNFEIEKLRKTVEGLQTTIDTNMNLNQKNDINVKLHDIYDKLVSNGIEEKIVYNILKEISHKLNIETKSKKELINIVKKHISNYLGEPQPISLVENKQKIIFFIGPTGVGKTTTLSKIAAQYVLENKENIGLITADTYRIAAVEQLKTYSDVLNVPLKIMYDTKDIYDSLSKLKDKEVILIDTAGRNHNNNNKMNELNEIIQTVNNKEVFLVLSATTSFDNIKSIIDKYKMIDNYKIIFTKIDESNNIGVVLNTRIYSNKPLSYITNGQNVPEDISKADNKYLCDLLIGE